MRSSKKQILARVKKSRTTYADEMRERSAQDHMDAYGLSAEDAQWLEDEIQKFFYGDIIAAIAKAEGGAA